MEVRQKNSYIELLRFIFCITILLHHSGLVSPSGNGLIPSAGIIADGFFILTGYFACRHVSNMTEEPVFASAYSLKYTFKKLGKVIPYSTFGIVIIYILELLHLNGTVSIPGILNQLYTMAIEILLLPMLGVMEVNLSTMRNAPLWYLSATLVALPFVMYLMQRCGRIFKYLIAWLAPVLLNIWMVNIYGGALPWMNRVVVIDGSMVKHNIFLYSGAVRGFSSITLGCLVYYLSVALAKKDANRKISYALLFTLIELVLLAFVYFNVCRGVGGYTESITIFALAAMLVFTLSGTTMTSWIHVKWFEWLGRISLPVYCMHWGVYRWVGAYLGMLSYGLKVGLTIVLSIIASVVLIVGVSLLGKKKR